MLGVEWWVNKNEELEWIETKISSVDTSRGQEEIAKTMEYSRKIKILEKFEDKFWDLTEEQEKTLNEKIDEYTSLFENKNEAYEEILRIIETSKVNLSFEKFVRIIEMLITSKEEKKEELEKINTKAENEQTKAENEQVKLENIELDRKQARFKELESSVKILKTDNPVYWDVILKIQELREIAQEKWKDWIEEIDKWVQELLEYFEKNPNVLLAVYTDLQRQDEINWTKNAERFLNVISEYNPSLWTSIKTGEYKTMTKLWNDNLKNVKFTKDSVKQKTDDWFEVEHKDWNRTISVQWSKYKINANVEDDKSLERINKAEKNLKEKIEPLQNKLNTVKMLQDFVEKAILENWELEEVKKEIKENIDIDLYTELNIDNANSLQDIQVWLAWIYAKTEEIIQEEEKKAKLILSEIVRQNKEKVQEKMNKKKEILGILNRTYVDLLWEWTIEWLFAQINNNPWLMREFWFKTKIDIENWILWTEENWEITENSKEAFIRLFNIVTEWNSDFPLKSEWEKVRFVDEDGQFTNILNIEEQTRNRLWSSPRQAILENIKKYEESKRGEKGES